MLIVKRYGVDAMLEAAARVDQPLEDGAPWRWRPNWKRRPPCLLLCRKWSLASSPRAVTAVMMAMPTKTAISAYSIEVAPDWSVANCLSRVTMNTVHLLEVADPDCAGSMKQALKGCRSAHFNGALTLACHDRAASLLVNQHPEPRTSPGAGLFPLPRDWQGAVTGHRILNAIERLQTRKPAEGEKVH